MLDAKVLLHAAGGYSFRHLSEDARRDPAPEILASRGCCKLLRHITRSRGFWLPWTIGGAVGFLLSLLGLLVCWRLVAIARHADVLTRTLKKLSDFPSSESHYVHKAVLKGDHGTRRCRMHDADLSRFPFLPAVGLLRVTGNYQ